jgi:hypothetical protein
MDGGATGGDNAFSCQSRCPASRVVLLARDDAGQVRRIAVVHELHAATRQKEGSGTSEQSSADPLRLRADPPSLDPSCPPARDGIRPTAARQREPRLVQRLARGSRVGLTPMQMAVTKLPHGNKGEHRASRVQTGRCNACKMRRGSRAGCDAHHSQPLEGAMVPASNSLI